MVLPVAGLSRRSSVLLRYLQACGHSTTPYTKWGRLSCGFSGKLGKFDKERYRVAVMFMLGHLYGL